LHLESDIEPKKVDAFEKKKAALLEEIVSFQEELGILKVKRSETNKHIIFPSYRSRNDLASLERKRNI